MMENVQAVWPHIQKHPLKYREKFCSLFKMACCSAYSTVPSSLGTGCVASIQVMFMPALNFVLPNFILLFLCEFAVNIFLTSF
jgi:hypothetical protein